MMVIRGDIAGCITVLSCNIYIYIQDYTTIIDVRYFMDPTNMATVYI